MERDLMKKTLNERYEKNDENSIVVKSLVMQTCKSLDIGFQKTNDLQVFLEDDQMDLPDLRKYLPLLNVEYNPSNN